jgi:cytochrome c biogenesis protein ResB
MGLFIRLAVLMLVVCVIGGVIPQDGSAPDLFARWGIGGAVAAMLGLGRIFTSWWFIALLGLLAANLAACSIRSFRSMPGMAWVVHAGMLAILAGGMVTGTCGIRGEMPLEKGKAATRYIVSGLERELPFGVGLRRFSIEYYRRSRHLLAVVTPDSTTEFELEPGCAVALGPGITLRMLAVTGTDVLDDPAVLVEVVRGAETRRAWIRQDPRLERPRRAGEAVKPDIRYRYEASRIRQFTSAIEIMEGGKKVADAEVSVNSPFSWRGWRFHQAGYDEGREGYTVLQVSRDPGARIVYAGFAALVLGLAWSFLKEGGSDE